MPAVVETFGLTKIYKLDFLQAEYGRLKVRLSPGKRRRVALKDLSLAVEDGEIFGLLGPNGAGKTTTLKILMGIIFATRGTARLLGRPLGDKWAKARIGFLPENPYFYDYLTGREFLKYYAQLYGIPRSERLRRADALLERVGLREAANLPLRGYSKGMLQRIGLAQAILNDPQIVILDEPQSGLDPLGRKEIRDIILQLREEGKAVFFSSHILSDAEMLCDRVGILYGGELKNIGRLSDLLSHRIKEYEIVARGVSEAALEQWKPRVARLLVQRDEAMIVVREENDAREVLSAIQKLGATLTSFNPRRETLEEYFIEQVRGEKDGQGLGNRS
ncbi:ABC transporter ATP-binding protein [Candidatus Sumerlaeota bacterium]|nr:ABC transporter ATP-binding protein [Candidatus Sumerlaeota bacterium]